MNARPNPPFAPIQADIHDPDAKMDSKDPFFVWDLQFFVYAEARFFSDDEEAIVLAIREKDGRTAEEVAERVGLPSNERFHALLGNLVSRGIIDINKHGDSRPPNRFFYPTYLYRNGFMS
jgi:hypothetical protein